MSLVTPLRIEKVLPKGRRGLRLDVVDRNGKYVIGGFGYFQEETLRAFCAAVNLLGLHEALPGPRACALVELREISGRVRR